MAEAERLHGTYICSGCAQTFPRTSTPAELEAEARSLFGPVLGPLTGDEAVMCDDCFGQLLVAEAAQLIASGRPLSEFETARLAQARDYAASFLALAVKRTLTPEQLAQLRSSWEAQWRGPGPETPPELVRDDVVIAWQTLASLGPERFRELLSGAFAPEVDPHDA